MLREGHYVQSDTALAWSQAERDARCARCGKAFRTASRNKKYCSVECRNAFYRETRKEQEWERNRKRKRRSKW